MPNPQKIPLTLSEITDILNAVHVATYQFLGENRVVEYGSWHPLYVKTREILKQHYVNYNADSSTEKSGYKK